ncbi:MAG: hypothetical protein J6N76_00630 [Lachnospiraceae bacterium]|nr:hypothetical protein [Lachnospiraceae bacterium]
MSINEYSYKRLIDSDEEMTRLESRIAKGMKLHIEMKAGDTPYDPNTDGRELLEDLYERRLYLQYMGARTFHPYSEFGSLCLERAQLILDGYEKEIGILNTRITKNNIGCFVGSLTEDLIDDISTGRYQAIGALRYDGQAVAGVGSLVYLVDRDLLGDEYILRIKWLFVKEQFRRRGVATSLLGGILWKNKILENENVLVEVPIDKEWYGAYYNMLSDWHFNIESGYSPWLYLSVSKLKTVDIVKKMASFAKPLKELIGADRKKTFDALSREDDRLYTLLHRNIPNDYFDEYMSGICVKNGKLLGLILVHRLPSRIVRVEYMGGNEKASQVLLSHTICMAKKQCSLDTVLEFNVESEEIGEYFDKYFDDHLRTPMVMADLQRPTRGENIGPEDAMWFLSGV